MAANLEQIQRIYTAFTSGKMGTLVMPEDTHPTLETDEDKRIFYTLPMALNYQRNSYKLWEAATKTYTDHQTHDVFILEDAGKMPFSELQQKLGQYKLALQPNSHTKIWMSLVQTFSNNWHSISSFLETYDYDFLTIKMIVQKQLKKNFPYLSGPKIFNYWAYIMEQYGNVVWKNRDYIEIAPDTHVIQASIKLGVITETEAQRITREGISTKWQELLGQVNIAPIDMHSPLWFWSKSGFQNI